MHTLLRFLGTVAAVMLTIKLVPGVSATGGWETILLVALVWSVITIVIRPVLGLLTLPITIITFGLFSFVLNAMLFYAVTYVVPNFMVADVWSALIGAFVLSLISWFIQKIV